MKPIRYRIPINHKNIILKVIFPILFKSFFLRPEMVFNRENYFIVLKIFEKNQGNSVGIYFPYIRVSTHGHVQNIGQTPKKPFWIFQAFEIFTKEIFPKKFQENSSMSHMTCLMILPSLVSWRTV